jgi:hypothetical protein
MNASCASSWAVAPNADPQMSKNALASKHTHEPELRESSRGTRSAVVAFWTARPSNS